MHYDALTLACMAHELQTTLVDGRVQQVVLPNAESIGLEVYAGRVRHNLLISAQNGAAWVYCPSQKARRGVETETPLLQLLRKYVRNALLTQVRQPDPTERVLWLDFTHLQHGATSLVVELIGRHPNVLLLNAQGRILQCVHRVRGHAGNPASSDQTRVDQAHVDQATANPDRARTLMPGRDYVPPAPQAKLAPIDDGQEDYYTRLEQALQVPGQLWKALIAAVAGVSPSQARELAWRATGDVHALAQGTPVLAVVQALQALWGPRESGDWSPGTVHETGTESGLESHNAQARVIGYAPYVLHFRGSFQPQPTLSAAIELALGQAADSVAVAHNGPAVDAYAGLRKQVAAQLQKARRRVERQLAALAADEPAPGEPERLRSQAEWLLALQSQITRGQTELTVEVGVDAGIAGVDADGVLRIPLHATKSPVEQAQQLFKQAGKFTRAAQIIPQRRAQLETDLEFLDQLASDLALAENQPEIATVQQELRATRLLPPTGKPAPRVQAAAEPLRFLSAQGFEVVVGRNARQNELVTFKIAQAEDTWLHARAVPGAHVVIRNGGQTLDSETVVYAAQIAAYYSQARGERAAPVIVTPRKHITRAPGGRKGQVVVRQEETVTVRGELPTDAHAEADKA